jgi:hypothetical protein
VTPAVSVASVDADVVAMDDKDEASRPSPFEYSLMAEIGKLATQRCLVNPEAIKKMSELLLMQLTSRWNSMDFVVGTQVLATTDDRDSWKGIYRSFEDVGTPLMQEFRHVDGSPFGSIYWREGVTGSNHLGKNKDGTLKVWKNRSFSWTTPIATIWPPPLVAGPGISENTLWSFEVKDHGAEQGTLRAMAHLLGARYDGAFFAKVCDGELLVNPN